MIKLLICKDELNKKLITTQLLDETENIKYEFVENPPIVEERENEIGHYELDEQGDVIVVYEPKPKTQLDLIQEQLEALTKQTQSISADGLINMDLAISTEEIVTDIQTKLQ